MPKIDIDYEKTLIYKLIKKDAINDENIYIGSTTNFIQRKHGHKTSCNNKKSKKYNFKKYQYIRENGGWDEWNMIEIEKYPCNDDNEARAREEYHRRYFNATLNSQRCHTTDEEKIIILKNYSKEYRENNVEKEKERHIFYRKNNVEKERERHRLYHENNKEKLKEYRDNNKEKKSIKNKIKIECPICGFVGQKIKLKRHQETAKCLSHITTPI